MLSGSAIVHNDSTSALNPYTDEKCIHMSSGTWKGNEASIRRSADFTAEGGVVRYPYRLTYERRGGAEGQLQSVGNPRGT